MRKCILLLIMLLTLISCTDADMASMKSYGSKFNIKMYNGGVLVGSWTSTGKVSSMQNSDGWEFMDKTTGKLVRVGGDVIIEEAE